jgi:hypothetical protein
MTDINNNGPSMADIIARARQDLWFCVWRAWGATHLGDVFNGDLMADRMAKAIGLNDKVVALAEKHFVPCYHGTFDTTCEDDRVMISSHWTESIEVKVHRAMVILRSNGVECVPGR